MFVAKAYYEACSTICSIFNKHESIMLHVMSWTTEARPIQAFALFREASIAASKAEELEQELNQVYQQFRNLQKEENLLQGQLKVGQDIRFNNFIVYKGQTPAKQNHIPLPPV